ncbi:hypothetical protein T11_10552 [Trichinella zimbabwensis]|uniref:Uncharacterized protein n=1 Tax=Trichinella zimbabwensis TaxID=268475 RepID=A0A0V1F3N6_9BILA|nr:hypothetical protein T11_10552 [Trichinella zimbabwensis]
MLEMFHEQKLAVSGDVKRELTAMPTLKAIYSKTTGLFSLKLSKTQ